MTHAPPPGQEPPPKLSPDGKRNVGKRKRDMLPSDSDRTWRHYAEGGESIISVDEKNKFILATPRILRLPKRPKQNVEFNSFDALVAPIRPIRQGFLSQLFTTIQRIPEAIMSQEGGQVGPSVRILQIDHPITLTKDEIEDQTIKTGPGTPPFCHPTWLKLFALRNQYCRSSTLPDRHLATDFHEQLTVANNEREAINDFALVSSIIGLIGRFSLDSSLPISSENYFSQHMALDQRINNRYKSLKYYLAFHRHSKDVPQSKYWQQINEKLSPGLRPGRDDRYYTVDNRLWAHLQQKFIDTIPDITRALESSSERQSLSKHLTILCLKTINPTDLYSSTNLLNDIQTIKDNNVFSVTNTILSFEEQALLHCVKDIAYLLWAINTADEGLFAFDRKLANMVANVNDTSIVDDDGATTTSTFESTEIDEPTEIDISSNDSDKENPSKRRRYL